MHTLKLVAFGFGLLAAMVTAGQQRAGSAGIAQAATMFLPLWLAGAGLNLWFGVAQAGYPLRDEALVFPLVFGVPAAAALIVRGLARRHR